MRFDKFCHWQKVVFELVGSRPSNRSDKASRRQLPNQPVPKKANANTSIIHQGIANAEDGIHLLPSIGTKRVVTSRSPQLRSISASLCYRKQVDYMEGGRILTLASAAANTHTSTCQKGPSEVGTSSISHI